MKYILILILAGCSTFPPCHEVEPKAEKQKCLDEHYEKMDKMNERLNRFERGGLR